MKAWGWLVGALSLGIVVGVLANRILPAPRSNLPDLQDTAPVELISPLVVSRLETASSLIESRVMLEDKEWSVLHSPLDIGRAADIFDGNLDTLMRGASANPFVFEVRPPQPKTAGNVILHLARMSNFKVTITAVATDEEVVAFGQEYAEELIDPVLEFEVPGGARTLRSLRVEIFDRRPLPQEGFHTHVREFRLR